MMRRRITRGRAGLALIALAFLPLLFGEDRDALEASYKQKLAKEFMGKIPWQRQLSKAKALSSARNLPILAYFTRSYAP